MEVTFCLRRTIKDKIVYVRSYVTEKKSKDRVRITLFSREVAGK